MESSTYFDALYEPVMAHLKAYQNDFLESDKVLLEGYSGEFILGCRSSGTNLLKLCSDYIKGAAKPISFTVGSDDPATIEQLDINVDAFLFRNEIYFHGMDGDVRMVSKAEALKIYQSYRWKNQIKSYLEDSKKAA